MTIFDRIRNWFRPKRKEQPVTENNDKPTLEITNPPMVNTITLSSDMETLFLIDDGRAIEYDLGSPKGLLIGTLNGQLTVATAPVDSPNDDDESGATAPPTDQDGSRTVVKVSTKNAQWSATYNLKTQTLFFIGATDIDIGEPNVARGGDATPKVFGFDLKGRVANIRRIGNAIEIALIGK